MKIPFKNVLLSDILDEYPDVNPQTSSEEELEVLLYNLGIDINFGFERSTGLFRDPNDNCKVEEQYFIRGLERSDKVWRESEKASEELIEAFRGSIARSVGDKI